MSKLIGSESEYWNSQEKTLQIENNGFAMDFWRDIHGRLHYKVVDGRNMPTRHTINRWIQYADSKCGLERLVA